jgi:hypothetical protein
VIFDLFDYFAFSVLAGFTQLFYVSTLYRGNVFNLIRLPVSKRLGCRVTLGTQHLGHAEAEHLGDHPHLWLADLALTELFAVLALLPVKTDAVVQEVFFIGAESIRKESGIVFIVLLSGAESEVVSDEDQAVDGKPALSLVRSPKETALVVAALETETNFSEEFSIFGAMLVVFALNN